MADDVIDTVLEQLFFAREAHIALRDMYPASHRQVQDAENLIKKVKERLIGLTIAAERKRCADIVTAARFHEIETDLRSVISFIERGDTVEDLKKWSGRS